MRRREVAAEATRNLRATPIRSLLAVTLALACGFGLVWTTAHDTAAIANRFERQVRAGRFVMVVESGDGQPFDTGRCDAFAGVEGVEASGTVLRSPGAVHAANQPTLPITQVRLTPGMLGVLYPGTDLASALARTGVLVGPGAARTLGLVRGSTLRTAEAGDRTVAGVLPHSPRRPEVDDQIVLVSPAVGAARECTVAVDPDRIEAVDESAIAWFGISRRAVTSPFLDRPLGLTPERELTSRASASAPFVAAGVLALFHLAMWFARRQEFALYRLLGTSPARVLLLLASEAFVVVVLPVAIGASAAITATRTELLAVIPRHLVGLDLAAALVALLPLPAVAGVALLVRRPFEDLKGA